MTTLRLSLVYVTQFTQVMSFGGMAAIWGKSNRQNVTDRHMLPCSIASRQPGEQELILHEQSHQCHQNQ